MSAFCFSVDASVVQVRMYKRLHDEANASRLSSRSPVLAIGDHEHVPDLVCAVFKVSWAFLGIPVQCCSALNRNILVAA